METEKKEVPAPADTDILLVTANVGSLFEDPTRLLQIWLKEFIAKVSLVHPKFLALHLQEVGGKTYEKSMEYVQEFIRCLCDSNVMTDYVYVRIYMDEDFKSAEHFTALGNIYFAHKDLANLRIWNFLTHDWEEDMNKAGDKQIYSGNIETIPTKEKSKFPQHFFPECKWSRKGFMRTRWEINGTVIDLVNIHLFHDASNLAACEEFPSVYCKTRRRALVHTLERFHLDDKNGTVPFFLFGDFNFRCDTAGVVKELTQTLTAHRVQSVKNESTKMHYRDIIGNNVLTVGKKEFSHADHQLKFKEDWLKKYDRELEALSDILVEYPITFVPSYPFEEDPEMPTDYMSTRCPSWCDRILMSCPVKDVITEDDPEDKCKYNIIGESVCMGDHKPIYLTVHLKPNKGTYRSCDCSYTYTYANNNNNSTSPAYPVEWKYCPYTKYIYNEILCECKELNRERAMASGSNLAESSAVCAKDLNNVQLQTMEQDIVAAAERTSQNNDNAQQIVSSKNPAISINIIDSDNIYVCMCKPLEGEHIGSAEADGSICPVCRNIIKQQPLEHRYRLISKRLILSDNIIVNRIDTQHLNTYLEHAHDDPYTPESNESHSPYPELNSTSTTTSSNSRSPLYRSSPGILRNPVDSTDAAQDISHGKDERDAVGQEANMGQALNNNPIAINHSKGIVTPGQLKSRLEDLQRLSKQNQSSEHSEHPESIVVGKIKGDVENVEAICPPQRRNSSLFPKCCNIH